MGVVLAVVTLLFAAIVFAINRSHRRRREEAAPMTAVATDERIVTGNRKRTDGR